MPAPFKRFIKSWVINTLAVLLAVYTVSGIEFKDKQVWTPFVVALVLGILNSFVRPIILLVSLRLLVYTLGLFMLVINAFMLWLVGFLLPEHFAVKDFWSAFKGALVISVVSLVLNAFTGGGNMRVKVRRGNRPPGAGDGGGPVIDV
jgi:putative membrane protein